MRTELTKLGEQFSLDPMALGHLNTYYELLVKWQKTINLVGPKTIEEFWQRHLLDSLQLVTLIRPVQQQSPNSSLVDFGTGAGIPGLLLALSGIEQVTLVESDVRKSAFLKEVLRATNHKISIENNRIEKIPPRPFGIITARALASLPQLLTFSYPFVTEETQLIFPKGTKVEEELADSKTNWLFDCQRHKSLTSDSGVILQISNLRPKSR